MKMPTLLISSGKIVAILSVGGHFQRTLVGSQFLGAASPQGSADTRGKLTKRILSVAETRRKNDSKKTDFYPYNKNTGSACAKGKDVKRT